ncbi:MAG: hypothetical protein CL917_01050 [Deltaproteobacteria bacterium]|nr:hypothetical protein [Deltaproteobacteria bacterium]
MKQVCVYHAGCPDGFGAAWATRKAWQGEGQFIPRGHDDRLDPRIAEGALLAFVDIAPSIQELEELADSAAHLIILDHHVTNQKRILGDSELMDALAERGHLVHFDMRKSGAMLAWDFFMPHQEAPKLLQYVEDQDLWNWKLPDSEAVNSAIGSYAYDFETWDELADRDISSLVAEGASIVRTHRVEVKRAVRHRSPLNVAGRRVEGVNSRTQRSAIGHALAERQEFNEPWGCVYRIEGTEVHATLYSIGDFDVGSIASELGGGGHRNAAGFTVNLESWFRDFLS